MSKRKTAKPRRDESIAEHAAACRLCSANRFGHDSRCDEHRAVCRKCREFWEELMAL